MLISGETPLSRIVDIDQLLTKQGKDTKFTNFIIGNAVEEKTGFIGKADILSDIERKAKQNGIVAIAGGLRGGKSSLLKVTSSHLIDAGNAQSSSAIYCASFSRKDKVAEMARDITDDRKRKIGKKNKKIGQVITFDEIETVGESAFPDFVDLIKTLRSAGNIVILNVIGDLNCDGNVSLELPEKDKKRLLTTVGNSIVVNRLFTDEETRQLVSGGKSPLFSPALIDYLANEAGGHPLLGALLAGTMFSVLRKLKTGELQLNQIMPEFAEEIHGYLKRGGQFSEPTDCVMERGFNPLTWEYSEKFKRQPDEKIYRNMLPRVSSTFFKNWLIEYLAKRP